MKRSLGPASLNICLAFAFAGFIAAADDLPRAEVLLDKYIEVTGGKIAYAKIHSYITTGTMEGKTMGLKGNMIAYSAEPDKHYLEGNVDGMGKFQEGSNGEVAWEMTTMQGPRLKVGDEKDESLLKARFNDDLNWRDIFKTVETVGEERVDGKECYKVKIMPKTGSPSTRWYDKTSNLLVKVSSISKRPAGEIQEDTLVSDYRKEGDILVSHKRVVKMGHIELVMTLESMQYNAEIPKDRFDIPDEVKALLRKPN